MDTFGIGVAIESMLSAYRDTARGTGRTTALVNSARPGDRIVCPYQRESERIRGLCLQRGVDVEVIVVDPKTPERLFWRGTAQGRTLLEHTWVEEFYRLAIKKAQNDIDHWQSELSGYGEAHRETRGKAEKIHLSFLNFADKKKEEG